MSDAEPPLKPALLATIRRLAVATDFGVLQHARQRMQERDIDIFTVERVLRTGDIIGDIRPGKNEGEWQCKVVAAADYPDDRREVGVVTIVVGASRLLIKTVEWED